MQSDPATSAIPGTPTDRNVLRRQLRAARDAFVATPASADAAAALSAHLVPVLAQLEPQCLGLYWPIQSEFNAVTACAADPVLSTLPWALPYTHRPVRQMHFRHWDRQTPTHEDECGLLSSSGAPVVPDVLLLPCLGFTADGFRLGYGAGYFDRWLAAHPDTTAVGVAWSVGQMDASQFRPAAHDHPLMLVVTEHGVVSG
jgi:5-formyltetrahydrofolate cyclo-ligase